MTVFLKLCHVDWCRSIKNMTHLNKLCVIQRNICNHTNLMIKKFWLLLQGHLILLTSFIVKDSMRLKISPMYIYMYQTINGCGHLNAFLCYLVDYIYLIITSEILILTFVKMQFIRLGGYKGWTSVWSPQDGTGRGRSQTRQNSEFITRLINLHSLIMMKVHSKHLLIFVFCFIAYQPLYQYFDAVKKLSVSHCHTYSIFKSLSKRRTVTVQCYLTSKTQLFNELIITLHSLHSCQSFKW